jgi:hypothetical protein
MDGEEAGVGDGFVGDDFVVRFWRLLAAAARAVPAAGRGCGVTAGWIGIAGSLLSHGCRESGDHQENSQKSSHNIILMCLVLYERERNLRHGGAKGALKYDEWEKEASGRIKICAGRVSSGVIG